MERERKGLVQILVSLGLIRVAVIDSSLTKVFLLLSKYDALIHFVPENRYRWGGAALKAVAGVGLGEALALLDGHQLELSLLVNVQPGVGVVLAVPGHIGTTGEASDVPACRERKERRGREGDSGQFTLEGTLLVATVVVLKSSTRAFS